MTGTTRFFLSIGILPALLSVGLAQQALQSQSATRSVIVNVFDARGNAVRNLSKENFHVSVNGKPSIVLGAKYTLAPRRIVVLLDMSGSMIGEEATGKWRIARQAADDLLEQTPGAVPIALLTFSDKVRGVFDFSQGRAAIAKWLKEGPSQQPKLKYPGRTALFDAVLQSLKLLQPVQPGDAVYAITDGGENGSRAWAGQARSALLQSGVRLFAFLFVEPLPPSREQEDRNSFLSMVYDSGGFAFGVSGRSVGMGPAWAADYLYDDYHPEKAKLFTQQLDIQVNGFWTLELATPPSNKASKMMLDVVDDDGKIRKDVGVTYRRVLPALK
jgi:hypothetical protein